MKRFIYLVRCSNSAETLAFESQDDAQERVATGGYRGPFTVELIEQSPANEMKALGDCLEVEQPQAGGSIRA